MKHLVVGLTISFYFCKPYHSWECGANGNSPQKRLGYLTPNEKFNLLLTNQNSIAFVS